MQCWLNKACELTIGGFGHSLGNCLNRNSGDAHCFSIGSPRARRPLACTAMPHIQCDIDIPHRKEQSSFWADTKQGML